MFWNMAVVLKATQEASAASALGTFSLSGTLAKSERLETHGNMTSLGKVQPPGSESQPLGFLRIYSDTGGLVS